MTDVDQPQEDLPIPSPRQGHALLVCAAGVVILAGWGLASWAPADFGDRVPLAVGMISLCGFVAGFAWLIMRILADDRAMQRAVDARILARLTELDAWNAARYDMLMERLDSLPENLKDVLDDVRRELRQRDERMASDLADAVNRARREGVAAGYVRGAASRLGLHGRRAVRGDEDLREGS